MLDVRIDATAQEATGRSARSLPFGGGCAMIVGGLMLGLGLVFAAGFGLVAALADRDLGEHKWLVPPAILFLVLIGGGLVRVGIRDERRKVRAKRQAALHPDEPWFADAPWDRSGTPAESTWDGTSQFVVLFVLLIMAPFNVLWLHVFDPKEETMTRLFALMVLIPDFFMYLIGRGLFTMARDRIRHGRPQLSFDRFPFPLGGSLCGRVTVRALAGRRDVRATLRCIDERMVTVRSGGDGPSDMVKPFLLHEVCGTFPGVFDGQDVPLELPLPERPATELLRQPPLYWELEIAGQEGDEAVRFIVPVYAG
jgi:hypothetical protein